MNRKEIIIKETVLSKLILLFVVFVIFFILIVKYEKKNFELTQLFENGLISFFSISLILFLLATLLKIFDNKPTLKLNKTGVWYRNVFIPFTPFILIEWDKIDFVELNIVKYSKYKKGDGIIISKKGSLRTKTIYLDSLNYPKEEIIEMFKQYSNFLNFKDRIEIKNNN